MESERSRPNEYVKSGLPLTVRWGTPERRLCQIATPESSQWRKTAGIRELQLNLAFEVACLTLWFRLEVAISTPEALGG